MARNGSGIYTLPAGNPVTTGTTISSTWANNTLNDLGNAMTASLAYDGQTVPVANLPMGGYVHTNVGNATARTSYPSAGQVQDGTFTYLTSVTGTDTITALAPLSMSALVAGQEFKFIAAGANTTTGVTLNINSIGAKNITKNGATALAIGDIKNGQIVSVVYDGTQFQLQTNIVTTAVTSFSAGSTGLTPSTATTGAVTLAGTLGVANGGTGATSLTANNVILGNGTSAVQVVAPGTSGNALVSDGTTWTSAKQTLTSGTAQATTSGTSFTFTGIPSWVKRITVIFNGVSTNGSSLLLVQIGSGSVTTSGYTSQSTATGTVGTGSATSTAGFIMEANSAAETRYGHMVITLISGNIYVSSHSGMSNATSNGQAIIGGGGVTLGGTLDRVVLTTVNGTDTFDAGSVNIIYE